ncbi:MAG: hypothetical protein PVG27_00465, partial [Chloroflexota bacterium]
ADADLVTRLTRADFDAMVAQLDAAELPVVPDLDRAWETFAPMRAAFEPALLGLCRLLLPPPSRWGADLLARPEPR